MYEFIIVYLPVLYKTLKLLSRWRDREETRFVDCTSVGGCKAWVKRLDVRKLEPRAVDCHFVGVDTKSKGYRIYWHRKNCVGIERDVYFDESEVFEPEEVEIEGGNDTLTNSKQRQPPNTNSLVQQPSQPLQTVPSCPNESEIRPDEHQSDETLEKTAVIQPNIAENPTVPPHQRNMRCNSLDGLQQFNNKQFGHGK